MTFKDALLVWKSKNKPPRFLEAKHIKEINKLVTVAKGHCYFCNSLLKGRQRKWCGEQCITDFGILCGLPHVIRNLVLQRDKGICSKCNLDTIQLKIKLFESTIDVKWLELVNKFSELLFGFKENKLHNIIWLSKRALWDCDHIIAVKDGGGSCGLENYQTLCIACHRKKTHGTK